MGRMMRALGYTNAAVCLTTLAIGKAFSYATGINSVCTPNKLTQVRRVLSSNETKKTQKGKATRRHTIKKPNCLNLYLCIETQ